jgi:hypothetical protein
MGVILAFFVGYMLGTRAGGEGMEQLLDSLDAIARSDELGGFVGAGLDSHWESVARSSAPQRRQLLFAGGRSGTWRGEQLQVAGGLTPCTRSACVSPAWRQSSAAPADDQLRAYPSGLASCNVCGGQRSSRLSSWSAPELWPRGESRADRRARAEHLSSVWRHGARRGGW